MNTRKRGLIALLVCAVLAGVMLSGCPGDVSGSDDNGNGGNPSTNPDDEFQIANIVPPTGGTVTFSKDKAKAGDTITVTIKPNATYELDSFAVFKSNNTTVPHSPQGFSYSYSFTMPNDDVRIRAEFKPVADAIQNAANIIKWDSSWDDFAALSSMISNAQSLGTPVDTKVTAAITKLVGSIITSGSGLSASNGLIGQKMRSEDLDKWITLAYPSYKIDKGVSYGADRTYLYYVKEDNLTIPPLSPGKGWIVAGPQKPIDPIAYPYLEDAQQIKLSFQVGNNQSDTVEYLLLLIPTAQYTIQYVGGAGGDVTIQDFKSFSTIPNTATGPAISANNTAMHPSPQTLNSNNPNKTGDVGALLFPTLSVRAIYTEIKTTAPSGFYVSVRNAQGFVLGTNGTALTHITASGAAYFFPESIKYTIQVRSTSTPTPMQ
jgi:hypothetical protein